MTSLAEQYFAESFSRDLIQRDGRVRPGAGTADSERAALRLGCTVAPAAAQLIDLLASLEAPWCFGEFALHDVDDWLAPFDVLLGEGFRLIGAFTDTLVIGSTGGGDLWLLEPATGELFLYDHETTEIAPACANAPVFALLQRALADGDAVQPELVTALAGRIGDQFDLPAPAGSEPLASTSRVPELGQRASLMLAMLGRGYEALPSQIPVADEHPSKTCDWLMALWRAYLNGEHGRLGSLLDAARQRPALLLQESIALLEQALERSDSSPLVAAMQLARPKRPAEPNAAEPSAFEWASLGGQRFAERDYRAALACYLKIAEHTRQGWEPVLNNLAYCYQQLGQHREAVPLFERALQLDATKAHRWDALAHSLWATAQWDALHAAALQATGLAPNGPLGWQHLAIALGRQQRWSEAESATRRLLELSPNSGNALYLLAEARLAAGARAEARALFARAIALVPELKGDGPEDRAVNELLAESDGA